MDPTHRILYLWELASYRLKKQLPTSLPFEERKNYYLDDTATMIVDGIKHNDSRFTLEEFQEKYGTIWLVGSMNNNQKTLNEEMSNTKDKCIAPPEYANYELKKLIRK